jgi:lysophospholipase-1
MLSTVSSVNQLISAEIDSGIDPGRIVVGGFSQGGAMSLLTAFTNEHKLAGAVCLSGWVVLKDKLKGVGELLCPWEPTLTQLAPDVLSARVVGANLLGTWHR